MNTSFEKRDIENLRKNEDWRFAHLGRICTDALREQGDASPAIIEKCIEESRRRAIGASGIIVFVDDVPVYTEIDDTLKNSAVFCETSELSFSENVKFGMDAFIARHAENASRGGFFLSVNANTRIDEPFVVFRWQVSEALAQFPFARVKIGENSFAKLCEFYCSIPGAEKTQTIARNEILVEAGAEFFRDVVQSLEASAQIFRMENVITKENATTRGVDFCLGAGLSRTTTELRADGRGANLNWRALNVAAGEQEIDWRTIQHHSEPGARSHLLCKNALLDCSRTIFSGSILVDKIAQQTNAVQSCRNLVLSETAEAHALPGLEIDANDVQCSHGSTTGTLDAEQLFYLLQRGLPEAEARMLLTLGFMDEVINACAGCAVADFVREKIAEKFGA